MQIQQVRVKISARQSEFDQEPLIAIFHRWIRENRLGDHLLIDVADYRHVPEGPGIMLIAHEAHLGLDEGNGQLGMMYARKRDAIGEVGPRLAEAFGVVLTACDALVKEPSIAGTLDFDVGRVEIHVMSRLVAPNTAETFDAFRPLVSEFLAALYSGADIALHHLNQPRRPFGVRAEIAGEHQINDLLTRLASL
ncbi:MAG: hypothetical protein MJE77_43990 [Proteobacteria bacterium]|nr:hypothetical protein [Pseudomonadota bacterium]